MSKIRILFFILSYSSTLYATPLTLTEVVNSALQAFPGLLATQQRKDIATGELQTAQGGFDTQVKLRSNFSVTGLYENQNFDASFEQPTALGGTTFFGGWRRGSGDYPVYEGKSLTATDGEVRVGVSIPLWRNREIDRRRASLQQAELSQLIANHDYDQALLEVRRIATHRYWDWILAGQRLKFAERLLSIAEQRDQGIRERVAAGDLPEFEALDNQRAIIERRERKVAAQRLLEQSAIQLSLYLRDDKGQPCLPEVDQLPQDLPRPAQADEIAFEQAVAQALSARPELRRLEIQQKHTQTELAFQQNQRAPGVDLVIQGAQDLGQNPNKDKLNRDEWYVGLAIDIPLQRRVATGRSEVAAANVQRLKWERQLAEDRVAAEVKDVLSAMNAAKQRIQLSQQQQQAAEKLEQGEHDRFELGDSTLLFVNLRELAHGDAMVMVAEATTTLFKAHADYQAILANALE
ncbi:TolC family protein [Methylocucumis oryzae]|uniref:Type I secretion protein TolC n=1 Tax=Methylocucumis oryzae TaxID=1632867 RepID=A0A0F3IK33_9GAMM|nr:TolC family protein [Methylocucumis oryzae]KJV07042.1 type I secretion protein TolC [Methylocucumis oryzae]